MPDSTGVPSEECTESLPSQVHKSGSLRIVPCCLQQSFCPAGQPTGQPLEVEADISCSPQTKMENRGEHISESILLADGLLRYYLLVNLMLQQRVVLVLRVVLQFLAFVVLNPLQVSLMLCPQQTQIFS
ncbi:hypothetical protein V6N11_027031 [Hibiscus sabdariffa]|uniref:Uncharacterized protein n=1 Tax=Hibiscus sabdariffa TaxID=183260 RepID=A0ABR2PFQ4_9ROSI